MRNLPRRAAQTALFALALSALSACLDEEAAFKNRGLFADMPTVAGSFIGYITPEDKLTACGSCHLERQGEWEATGHAHAWAGLQDSEHAETSCEPCHSLNGLGNEVVEDAGYIVTRAVRYQDVQCESCHGPGLEHALNPSPATIPLAPMAVGSDLTTGCGECHQGAYQPFLEEWEQSRHGAVNVWPAGQQGTCDQCHTGEGALARLGITADYVEKASLSAPGSHMAITCAVCHDPHGGPDHAQLRFPIDVADVEQQLCAKCHNERSTPDPTNERGPHAPESAVLIGAAGWVPPGMSTSGLVMEHGMVASNEKLCAGCHVFAFGVDDAETGQFAYQSTGHLFKAIPCLDAEGRPQAAGDCEDTERSFQSCTGSGCHESATSVIADRTAAVARVDALVAQLRNLLDQIPRSEFDTDDGRYTVGEGSRFNAALGAKTGSAVHNPVFIEALLLESIAAMESQYGLMAAPGLRRSPLFNAN